MTQADRDAWIKTLEGQGEIKRFYGFEKVVAYILAGGPVGSFLKRTGLKQINNIKNSFKTPYQIAKEGGKHNKWHDIYKARSKKEIQKGIKSIEKQILEHKDKMRNPEKYIPNFKKQDIRKQENLVKKKWPSDIARQKEQKQILEGILNDRK